MNRTWTSKEWIRLMVFIPSVILAVYFIRWTRLWWKEQSTTQYRVKKPEIETRKIGPITVTKRAWSTPFDAMPEFDVYTEDKTVWLNVSLDEGKTYRTIPGGNTQEMIDERRVALAILKPIVGDKLTFMIREPGPLLTKIHFTYKVTNYVR